MSRPRSPASLSPFTVFFSLSLALSRSLSLSLALSRSLSLSLARSRSLFSASRDSRLPLALPSPHPAAATEPAPLPLRQLRLAELSEQRERAEAQRERDVAEAEAQVKKLRQVRSGHTHRTKGVHASEACAQPAESLGRVRTGPLAHRPLRLPCRRCTSRGSRVCRRPRTAGRACASWRRCTTRWMRACSGWISSEAGRQPLSHMAKRSKRQDRCLKLSMLHGLPSRWLQQSRRVSDVRGRVALLML